MTGPCSVVVEGLLDEVVARRLLTHAGLSMGNVYGRQGKGYIRRKAADFVQAGRHGLWLILCDLDNDAACAPELLRQWRIEDAPYLRVAVREIEAWFLADRDRIADFLAVSPARIPRDPEALDDPKNVLTSVARSSSRRLVREGVPPSDASGRSEGPAYSSILEEFVVDHWHVDVAMKESDSLTRLVKHLVGVAGA